MTVCGRLATMHISNGRAGSRGDKQMQLREMIKDAEKHGDLYGKRKIQIVRNPGEEPITFTASVQIQNDEEVKARLQFEIDRSTGDWVRNNPNAQERIRAISCSGEKFGMIIYPHHELTHNLPEVGWITSVYLYSFYTFGYRYIFQEPVNEIRKFILSSFIDDRENIADYSRIKSVSLAECKNHFTEEPKLGIIIPTDNATPVSIQVDLFDYHINFPLLLARDIIERLDSHLLDEGTFPTFFAPIICNKAIWHECIWDDLLGKPIDVK